MNDPVLLRGRPARRGHADAEPAAGLQRAVRSDARRAAGGARPGGRRRERARGRDRRRPARPSAPATTSRKCAPNRRSTTTERLFAQCGRMMMTIQRLPVPVIARVQGIATAAGCQLVAMCDLAVAAREARFAVSGVNLGLFCSTPSVALSRNLPRKAAFEMLVTGDFICRRRGARSGPRQPGRRRRPICDGRDRAPGRQAIVAKPRGGHRRRQGSVLPPARNRHRRRLRRLAAETMACNMMDEAALEGVQAFIDKRPPAWP